MLLTDFISNGSMVSHCINELGESGSRRVSVRKGTTFNLGGDLAGFNCNCLKGTGC